MTIKYKMSDTLESSTSKIFLDEMFAETDEEKKEIPAFINGSVDQVVSKPILVLVNPHSGRGKSLRIYRKVVSKFLDSHNIKHEVFVTTADTRVKDYLHPKKLDELNSYRSIVVISGDGLLYEVVNTIMSRPDWREVIKIPLGIVPTGSGNGLAYTLIKQSTARVKNQKEAIEYCCEQAVQSTKCTSDLVKIQYGDSQIIWSFLSIGWGLLANIDVDSEWLRRLGELRFTIYGLLRSLTTKSQRGRLSYQLPDNISIDIYEFLSETNSSESMYTSLNSTGHEFERHTESFRDQDDGEWIHIEDKFACLYAVNQSHVSRVTNFAPKSTLTDSLIYLTYVRGKMSPCQIVEFLLAIENGSHEKLSYVKVIPTKRFRFQPLEPCKVVVDGEVIPWNHSQGLIMAEIVPSILTISWDKNH